MLPKFLIGDNTQECPDKIFIIHTQTPRCFLEGNLEGQDESFEVHWIDEVPTQENVEKLIEEANDFLDAELESQEVLYDDEIANEGE